MADQRTNLPLAPRPETGPMQFGDDWPGVFIRGDDAFAYRSALDVVLQTVDLRSGRYNETVEGLRDLLASCDTRNNPNPQKVPLSGPLASAVPNVDVPEAEGLQNPDDQ